MRRNMLAAARRPVSRRLRPSPLLLLAALHQCAAVTHMPTAPVGTPGRLPDVLPSSVDNHPISAVASPAKVNVTGLVIASSLLLNEVLPNCEYECDHCHQFLTASFVSSHCFVFVLLYFRVFGAT